jgi:aminotransferase in exopolysaccharide biosynthesis
MFDEIIRFVRSKFVQDGFIALHEPRFSGREQEYLKDCIDSTFVSSVGKYVDRFEQDLAAYTGAKYAIATVNGTAALHAALVLAGVGVGDEIITQPLTFVATVNAIKYCGAQPCFVDVDRDTMGLSPDALRSFLEASAVLEDGLCKNRETGRVLRAVVPMHTFGHPTRIDEIVAICEEYQLLVVEDAAESLGSRYKDQHTGTFGNIGVFSFNGNKTITCGGGGAIVTNDEALARRAKHITTTAKISHPWEYDHDCVGFNYRMPNLNAALACAQLEQIEAVLENKRALAQAYAAFFERIDVSFVQEPVHARSNYWLNALVLKNHEQRDQFLEIANSKGVMARPVWKLMHHLELYADVQRGDLSVAEWLGSRLVNIPSSVRIDG